MAYTTINKPDLYFNTLLYTGNGSTLTVTGNNFQPDFTWIKERSAAGNHKLADIVRGPTKYLSSDVNSAEDTTGSGIQSWNSTGFILSNATDINDSSQTYAAWNWLGSNTTTNNTSGTISSTVCANTTSGFSVVSWTGNGTDGATVGHGLGATPKMIIIKNRSVTSAWLVQHIGLPGAPKANSSTLTLASSNTNGCILLEEPNPQITYGFDAQINGSGNSMIAYCFSEIKGFSKFGSCIGNGAVSDGIFVYTGFKPSFLLIKSSTVSGISRWIMKDNKRNTYNVVANNLIADVAGAENTDSNDYIDFLSNGFKTRGDSANINSSGQTYIYMAFAENPLVGTNDIPTTAR
jgi:hypothetical protein